MKQLKNIFALIFFVCCVMNGQKALAQNEIQIALNLAPPYSPYFTDYLVYENKTTLVITGPNALQRKFYLRGTITGDNGISITTHTSFKPAVPLQFNGSPTLILKGIDIEEYFKWDNVNVQGTDLQKLAQGDGLPEGNYTICIRAYDYTTNEPLSQDAPGGCVTISIRNIEPPIINLPRCGTNVISNPAQTVVFSWNPPPGAPPTTRYLLKMSELPIGFTNYNDALNTLTTPAFFEKEINTLSYAYTLADAPLTIGKTYAFKIVAFDINNRTNFRNRGESEVCYFTYVNNLPSGVDSLPAGVKKIYEPEKIAKGNPPPIPTPSPLIAPARLTKNCSASCTEAPPTGVANLQIKEGDIVKVKGVGKFEMKIVKIDSKTANGKYTGAGTISVPFLHNNITKIKVLFKDAVFNNSKQLTAGIIKGKINPGGASLIPQLDNPNLLNFSKPTLENIINIAQTNQIGNAVQEVQNAGFELPIGIHEGAFNFAIVDFTFSPEQASFSIATIVDIPDGNEKISLLGKNICFDDENSLCGGFGLYMTEDLNITALNLKLKGQDPNVALATGTFMVLDKPAGSNFTVKQFHVSAEYIFPANTLIDAANKLPLKTTFDFDAKNGWQDWMAELSLPKFYVYGVSDIKFDAGSEKIFYDHSDFQNPPSLPAQFKSSDPAETVINTSDNTWNGLFIPKTAISLPAIISKAGAADINIQAKNLLYDNNGLTVNIEATNIIAIGDGSLAGWYASLDTIKFEFFKTNYKYGSMGGLLVLPPSGGSITDKKNQLQYNALLTNNSQDGLMYSFSVKPVTSLEFKALYMKLSIANNSHILVERKKQANGTYEPYAEAVLNGALDLDTKSFNINAPGIKFPGVKFSNMQVMTKAPYYGQNMLITFASPQKNVAGFELALKVGKPKVTPTGLGVTVGLDFGGNINLLGSEDKSSWGANAEANFTLLSDVKYNISTKRIDWGGAEIKINDISLGANATLGPVKLAGAIKYFNTTKDGEGFVGALDIGIDNLFKAYMKAKFGYLQAQQFSYFDFSALVDFGNKPLPFISPLNLYGFGGGIAFNEKIKSIPTGNDITPASNNDALKNDQNNVTNLLNYNPAGISYEPQKDIFSLSATVLFGLPNRNSFDADATLGASINLKTGGLESIKLIGNARIMADINAPITQRNNKSVGVVKLEASMDFTNSTFQLDAGVDVGVPNITNNNIVKANGRLQIHIDPSNWWVYCGQPQNPNTINLLKLGNSYIFNGTAYFEMGTRIDPMPPIPADVIAMGGGKSTPTDAADRDAITTNSDSKTSGIVFGSSVGFDFSGKFLIFYGALKAKMGYDLALNRLSTNCGAYGANGWYAKGQAYLGARVALGIDVDVLFIKGRYSIFDAGMAATIQAELPNPVWVRGDLYGQFSILDDLISGNFHYKFEIGERLTCVSNNANGVLGDVKLISEILPDNNEKDVEITAIPTVSFNIKQKDFVIKEMKDDGKSIERKFRFDKECLRFYINNADVTDKFKKASPNTFIYDVNELLTPKTNYKVTVRAKIKILEGADYVFYKTNGKEFEETKEATFLTNNGLKKLNTELIKTTQPLHSHTAILKNELSGGQFIETKKLVKPSDFEFHTSSTTYIAKLYKNGSATGSTSPVEFEGNRFVIKQPFSFENEANYRIELTAKKGGKMSEIQNTVKSNFINYTGYSANTNINNVSAGGRLQNTNYGILVSAINFTTSKYNSFKEKMNALQIKEVWFGANIISNKNSVQQNSAVFKKIFGGEAINKSIHSNYAVILEGDERLNIQDINKVTSNNVFKINSKNNATIEAQEYGTDQITADFPGSIVYIPDDLINSFLAENTGIEKNKININFQKKLGGCCKSGFAGKWLFIYTESSFAPIGKPITYKVEDDYVGAFTSKYVGNMSSSKSGSPSDLFKKQYVIAGLYPFACPPCNVELNPSIQNIYKEIFYPIVNPVFSPAISNNINTWEKIGVILDRSISNSAGSLNGGNLKNEINKSFNQ